jgi:hypothetical protein
MTALLSLQNRMKLLSPSSLSRVAESPIAIQHRFARVTDTLILKRKSSIAEETKYIFTSKYYYTEVTKLTANFLRGVETAWLKVVKFKEVSNMK